MKVIYNNINKKAYSKPNIEVVLLDVEMSLVMSSPPGEPCVGEGCDETGDGDTWVDPNPVSGSSVDYDSDTYKSSPSPFGGSRPAY